MKIPSPWRRHLLGITGGIAAGKSRVARYLAEHCGLATIDTDQLARELLRPGQAGWLALERRYGERFFHSDSTLHRPRLRRDLFADADLRAEIDRLLHPLIREAMLAAVARLQPVGRERILVEVPLLYEAGWESDFACIIAVWAPEEVCLARLLKRDGVSPEEAAAALAAQMAPREKLLRADLQVDNSGPWEETCRQLEKIQKIIEKS
ncbi:MAG: dephospho-CoA kinase [Desulfurivibrio sp.]